MTEESLCEIQDMMLGPEELGMRSVNAEESYKPPWHSNSEIAFQQE